MLMHTIAYPQVHSKYCTYANSFLFFFMNNHLIVSIIVLCVHLKRICDKSQEARRVLLSDINFTSMVPELSRSADHLCQDDQDPNNGNNENATKGYYKGHHLKTPDYSTRG